MKSKIHKYQKINKITMGKKVLFVFILFTSFLGMAQSSLNDYNMAIIPARFDFQKEDNQYRINSTIKAFLQQKGFEVYLSSDNMPEEWLDYNCGKVFVNVITKVNMFATKLQIEFKNCKNKVLFTTDYGESRSKEYSKSFNEALQLSLKTFSKANYKYSGKTYFDEEADEKIKNRDVENVSVEVVEKEKNESFIKVFNKVNQKGLILYKTSKPNIYLSIYNGRNGVVVSKENVWFFEYIDGDKITSEKIDIKF